LTPCPLHGKAECQFYKAGCTHPSRAMDYNCHRDSVDIVCRDHAGRRRVVLTMSHDEFCVMTVRYPWKEVRHDARADSR
jgi:hypothetical protein